jgi:putative endonuclease
MRGSGAKTYWVYILASKARGVLYIGMTSDLAGRGLQHRDRMMEGFAKRYWVQRLVYFEAHDDPQIAARRERALKRWRRDWKIALVEKNNPTRRDLFEDVVRDAGFDW